MTKSTEENIKLPDFPVAMVQKVGNDFVESDIVLSDFYSDADASNTDGINNSKGLVLYFYPKDSTPGCTTQATDFTAKLADFHSKGYDVIGVSRDSIESHKKFIDKYDLKIALISDTDERLCQHFDVVREKNMYGKKTLGLVRSTFVFDAQGELIYVKRNLRAKDYADRLLETL